MNTFLQTMNLPELLTLQCPQLLVDMILALVQRLFRPRIRNEFAWISIDGTTYTRCRRRIYWQARHGLCALCTEWGIKFSNSPCPQLLIDILLVLAQRLFRPSIRLEFHWISIWRHYTALPVTDTLAGPSRFVRSFHQVREYISNFPCPQLLVDMLLVLVQRLFRPSIRPEFPWISIDGTIRRWRWRIHW